ncbi:tyrosine-type recombinase/integrase [Bacillus sp. EB106-08-02-XG196]|uniref:tyrosine-type recombinase/integrase n=1 Tax=Bacillus sp. EB106-08-02-XG196 TaxID=2737049 RepID=UPI0034D1E4B2
MRLNNGAPIDVIQSLLGHEKSETTRIYAQLSGSIRRECLSKIFLKMERQRTPLPFYYCTRS